VEQQGRENVFRLRFMQRGSAGRRKEAVERYEHSECVRGSSSDHHLRLRLLRHQKQPIGVFQIHRPEKHENENIEFKSPLNPFTSLSLSPSYPSYYFP